MSKSKSRTKRPPKRVLALLDHEHARFLELATERLPCSEHARPLAVRNSQAVRSRQ